ncbi:MAG: alpha-galactosidase [Agriterribacter sp.]
METTVQPRISNPGDLVNVENTSEMNKDQLPILRLDRLGLQGNHWKVKAVQFFDITDRHTTTTKATEQLAYIFSNQVVGNLLLMNNLLRKEGVFWLKEAPSPSVQFGYPGFDFSIKTGAFQLAGAGITAADITTDEWTRGYGFVVGVSDGTEYGQLKALRSYQNLTRRYIPSRDDMVMMNTWGERGEGKNLNESFALREIDKASEIGIDVFQLDAGWYQGGTKKMDSFWLPHQTKFPNGLDTLVKVGATKNVKLSLWYEPDPEHDYANWQRDANIVIRLHQQFGINIFKIDGVQIVSKSGEINFRKLLDKVLQDTDNKVFFNIDITAGRRNGFHYFNEYGNFFLENRYTDWGNYYPYQTLRNAWLLCRYMPLQKLLIEFLNNERNKAQYVATDSLAPGHTSFEYSFATTIMAQPLAWIEAHRLSKNQMAISGVVKTYRKYQHDIHAGDIYPIGNEPDGYSWTGFQSMQQKKGYVIVYRERSEMPNYTMPTWFKPGTKISFTPVLGIGKPFVATAAEDGRIRFNLPVVNSYGLYSYKILN